jgi:hypothetical protein
LISAEYAARENTSNPASGVLLAILALILVFLPLNSIVLLQFASVSILTLLLLLERNRLSGQEILFIALLGGLIPLLALFGSLSKYGWQGLNSYTYLIRPMMLSGVCALSACWARNLSFAQLYRFQKFVIYGAVLIYLSYLIGFDSLSLAYKDAGVVMIGHQHRLSGPFLYPSDLAIFLVISLIATIYYPRFVKNRSHYRVITAVIILLLIATQSKLGIIGLILVLLFEARKTPLLTFSALILSVVLGLAFQSQIVDVLGYSMRLFTDYEFFLTASKRASEFLYLLQNWPDFVFTGAKRFELVAGLDTFESSAISLFVRFGVVLGATTIITSAVFLGRRGAGKTMLAVLGLAMLIAAPFDRPKLLVALVPLMAIVLKCRQDQLRSPLTQ